MQDARPAFLNRLAAVTLTTGGVTADITRLTITPPEDSWYFPRHPGLTRIVPQDALAAEIRDFVTEHHQLFVDGVRFGAWVNPDSQLCYLDLITWASSRREAERLARRYGEEGGRQVVAIYNPVRGVTERLRDI